MYNENEADIITLVDQNGESFEFEILDKIENDKGEFFALIPMEEDYDSLSEYTYCIFQVEKAEDGEDELVEVNDSKLLNELSDEFEKRYEENTWTEQ